MNKLTKEDILKGCGRKFNHFIYGERICGRFEDLKHSNHIILCPICQAKLEGFEAGQKNAEEKLNEAYKLIKKCKNSPRLQSSVVKREVVHTKEASNECENHSVDTISKQKIKEVLDEFALIKGKDITNGSSHYEVRKTISEIKQKLLGEKDE